MFFNKITRNIILFNTSSFHTTQYNAAIGRSMKKVMAGVKKKRRVYSEEPSAPESNTFADLFKKNNPENTRRLSVLNKLFMMRVTDLMTTGDNATDFAGYGLEINRVKVTPDYHGLNIYWIAKESANDEEIEDRLKSKSGLLRHELSQLHVIGMVPKINFIKDKEFARFMEVDSRLAIADYGEDFERSDASIQFKSYLELKKPLDRKMQERITTMEEVPTIEDDEEIPPMPQNVLALNHSEIMDRIMKSMKKTQASHKHQNENVDHPFNPDPIEFKSAKAQREAFKQFLSERQILKSKTQKMKKNYRPDWDYLEEESLIQKENQINSYKFDNWDDADYIEDDDCKNNSGNDYEYYK